MSPSIQNGGGIFSRKGSRSRVAVATPSTRPSTSSGFVSLSYGSNSEANSSASTNSSLSRKPSFTLVAKSPYRRPSIVKANLQKSPERKTDAVRNRSRPPTSSKATERRKSIEQASPDVLAQSNQGHETTQTRSSNRESISSVAPYSNMLSASSFSRELRPLTSYHVSTAGFGAPSMMVSSNAIPTSPTVEGITYQHIQDLSSKRISTLDYLRKAHEGRVYWFNTLLFNKPDLARMPYFDSRKLARRATNYLLLGLSLPTVLDLNSSTALDFLRTLNALMSEFETFQQIHPPDGSTSSSLSRARLPQMFKRAAGSTSGKGRRTSSAADIGLPMGNESQDTMSTASGASSAANFSSSESELLPGEEYAHLLTPSLPFDPDFYETFATLCDVLIDCYTKLMSLLSSPKECGPQIAELFTKVDARVRKIIIQGVVKEFEDTSRNGVRGEVASVGKVVLGGLM